MIDMALDIVFYDLITVEIVDGFAAQTAYSMQMVLVYYLQSRTNIISKFCRRNLRLVDF